MIRLYLLEIVKSDTRYSLHKRFAANFRDEGIIQAGNNYSEHKDEHEYYVVDAATNTNQPVSLKAKTLKTVFASGKEKVNSYFKQHNTGEIDEKFLVGLVTYLNQ